MHLLIRRQRALVTVQGRSDMRCRENDLKNKIEIKKAVFRSGIRLFCVPKRKINQRLRKYTELLIAFLWRFRVYFAYRLQKKKERKRKSYGSDRNSNQKKAQGARMDAGAAGKSSWSYLPGRIQMGKWNF